jgi:hypothetical protein
MFLKKIYIDFAQKKPDTLYKKNVKTNVLFFI